MKISPTSIRDYARTRGWTLVQEAIQDRLFVLQNPLYQSRQLVFPMDVTAPDYEEVVTLVAEKLAFFEGKTVERIFAGLEEVRDDTLRLRIKFRRDETDSIPLAFATTAVNATQQLLLSAAHTVLRPQTHHPRLRRSEAFQFIEAAQFKHTEHGSFVLKVSCPFDALDVPAFDGEEDIPFVRRTMLTLELSLRSLLEAIEGDMLDEYVEHTKILDAPLLSSNFCDALVKLQDEDLQNSLEMSLSWSALKPLAQPVPAQSLVIQRDYFPRIEEVRRALRDNGEVVEDRFVGTVEVLNGDVGADGRRAGQVTLALLLPDGEVVRANANLSAEQYAIADTAHMTDGAFVIVGGRLFPGRQPRSLTEIMRFELLNPQRNPPHLVGN